jgi:hypothetical protein
MCEERAMLMFVLVATVSIGSFCERTPPHERDHSYRSTAKREKVGMDAASFESQVSA